MLQQGLTVQSEFIGFKKSQTPFVCEDWPIPNHEELMTNFFAQADTLAFGRKVEEMKGEEWLLK